MFNLNDRSLSNLKGVHPDLVKLMHESIKDSPIPFIIICGVRTTEEQQRLYAQGRTASGLIVTSCDGVTNRSNHQTKRDGYGYAVDLLADADRNDKVDHIELNDAASLKTAAKHIKKVAQELGIPIVWGGDWKMRDYPHFELSV